jgi:hypothetical protein
MMLQLSTLALLTIGASAVAAYEQAVSKKCCGQISANGQASGITGQLCDGQIRIGGGYAPSTYCFNNGSFTDVTGKGCIITRWEPGVTQFQCDEGKAGQIRCFLFDSVLKLIIHSSTRLLHIPRRLHPI